MGMALYPAEEGTEKKTTSVTVAAGHTLPVVDHLLLPIHLRRPAKTGGGVITLLSMLLRASQTLQQSRALNPIRTILVLAVNDCSILRQR